MPLFPIIGSCLIIYVMTRLPGETWIRVAGWLAIGSAMNDVVRELGGTLGVAVREHRQH
jgi:C-terminus of AA_permease